MIDRQTDLAKAIVSDYKTMREAAKRIESRVYQYRGYAKTADSICNANDAIYEITRSLAKLEDALREM